MTGSTINQKVSDAVLEAVETGQHDSLIRLGKSQPTPLVLTDTLDEAGVDSLGRIEVTFRIGEILNVELEMDDVTAGQTVEGLMKIVQARIAASGEHAQPKQ